MDGGDKIMSTTMPKAGEISRKWYILDATDKPLGRVAAQAAVLLRGKHKPTFAPHVDCGDNVIIINCDKAILTGKKLEQKKFYWHTGWIGGLKEVSYKKLMAEQSDRAMKIAVTGMLPHNSQGAVQAKRLRTFKGAEHKHNAQKPEVYEF
jgi:large subunit ribosomal protein L13